MRTWPQFVVVATLVGLVSFACQERLADSPEDALYRFCTYVNAASVYDEEGNAVSMVIDPRGGHTPICRCLTFEEFVSGVYDDEMNDEAHEVCLANAATMGYPESHDCAYWRDIHHWGDVMFQPYPLGEIDPELCPVDDEPGCAVDST